MEPTPCHRKVGLVALLGFSFFLAACSSTSPPSHSGFALQELPSSRGIKIDLEYKKPKNITGKRLYRGDFRAYALPAVAGRLSAASSMLYSKGYGITVLDAWRPPVASALLWNAAVAASAREFFAPPHISAHTRGAAVDVTLHRLADPLSRVEMPSEFDHVGPVKKASPAASENAALLKKAMTAAGFKPYAKEWWHFELDSASSYPVVDVPEKFRCLLARGRLAP